MQSIFNEASVEFVQCDSPGKVPLCLPQLEGWQREGGDGDGHGDAGERPAGWILRLQVRLARDLECLRPNSYALWYPAADQGFDKHPQQQNAVENTEGHYHANWHAQQESKPPKVFGSVGSDEQTGQQDHHHHQAVV